MGEHEELEVVATKRELLEPIEHLGERSGRVDAAQGERGHAAQRDLGDHAECAERDARGAEDLGAGLGRAAQDRAVRQHERQLGYLGGDVGQACTGAVRGGGDRAGDRLGVHVAKVLQGEPVLGQAQVQLADRDARLDAHEPSGAIDVEHAREPIQVQLDAVGEGDVAERVPRAGDTHAAVLDTGADDGGRQLLDRAGNRDGCGQAPLIARPVAPLPATGTMTIAGARRTRALARPGRGRDPRRAGVARLAHQMTEPEPTASPGSRTGRGSTGSEHSLDGWVGGTQPGGLGRARTLPTPGARRATVIGAGSFGTMALAVLLARGGLRTTLQARTAEQAALLESERENRSYLPGVELPAQLRVEATSAGVARADYVFLAVPSRELGEVIETLAASGLGPRAAVVSVAKGLVPPEGAPPTSLLSARFGAQRVACLGDRRTRRRWCTRGRRWWRRAWRRSSRGRSRRCSRARGWCASSPTIPRGGARRGAAKNAAALAAGATEAQGLNAAGAAAGHIFAEVWRYAEGLGARQECADRAGGRGGPGGDGARARRAATGGRASCWRRACRRRRFRGESARRSRRWTRCRCWGGRSKHAVRRRSPSRWAG